MAKTRKARLGRGLSSLMATPVKVDGLDAEKEASKSDGGKAGKPGKAKLAGSGHTSGKAATVEGQEGVSASRQGEGSKVMSNMPSGASMVNQGVSGEGMVWVDVDEIRVNPYQPRRVFEESALEELASSIRQDGVMQPILLRVNSNDDSGSADSDGDGNSNGTVSGVGETSGGGYQLVAGERRWRASKMAGLGRVPAIVRELDDQQMAEWAIVENLQREDLNPIERAEAFAALGKHFSLTHDDIAERVGTGRSNVTNLLRLLDLGQDIQEMVRRGKLTAGHARALLSMEDDRAALEVAKRVIDEGWSVRGVEEAVRNIVDSGVAGGGAGGVGGANRRGNGGGGQSAHLADLERQLAEQLNTKVKLKAGRKKGTGTVSIEFFSLDEFDALLERLGVVVD